MLVRFKFIRNGLMFIFVKFILSICGKWCFKFLFILKVMFLFLKIDIIIFLNFLYWVFFCLWVFLVIRIVCWSLVILGIFFVLVWCFFFCFLFINNGLNFIFVLVYKNFIFFGLLILWVEIDNKLILNFFILIFIKL